MLYLSKHDPGKHKKAIVTLANLKETGGRRAGDSDDDSDCSDYGGESLKRLEPSTLPPEDVEVEVGGGVKLLKQLQVDGGGEKSCTTETSTIILSASGPRAEEAINAFISRAFEWYRVNVEQKKDETRYFFIMVRPKAAGGDGEPPPGATKRLYKRYALSDEKTFSSLFFPEKPNLLCARARRDTAATATDTATDAYSHRHPTITATPTATITAAATATITTATITAAAAITLTARLVRPPQDLLDHFMKKTGKFAVPGFPHKLGLLLYGPPGTGKTSLIKAIAHYTGAPLAAHPPLLSPRPLLACRPLPSPLLATLLSPHPQGGTL